MAEALRPHFPIIYVRGYAMTSGETAETVATPYMGFNLGSTKIRQNWDRRVVRHIFESPLIRLMKEYGYVDCYLDGAQRAGRLPSKSIVIYRYYDEADEDFGSGEPVSILDAARGLKVLIHETRDSVCGGDEQARKDFRVHLVAHSMGGLVCRAFLQNDTISSAEDRALVDKLFTYATPHNGIELAGINVPAVLRLWDMSNFNRKTMAGYLGLGTQTDRVADLDGKFDPQRVFCLVGTNHRDYEAALGLSRRLAGEMSDGLVRIENAVVRGAPRAFVHRSHSGAYGIVNSEEGYQNLIRFLFGDLRIDGVLHVRDLPLPPTVRKAHEDGSSVRCSYYFEATVAPRGAFTYRLTERRVDTYSAVLRTFDELMRPANGASPRAPVLFSTYLDSARIAVGRTVVMSVDLAVSTTGYTVDGALWMDRHISGEHLYRGTVTIRVTLGGNGPRVRYNFPDDTWAESRGVEAQGDAGGHAIPLTTRKGFRATLHLDVRQAGGDGGGP